MHYHLVWTSQYHLDKTVVRVITRLPAVMYDEILRLRGTPGISAKIFNMDRSRKIVPKVK